MVAIVEENLGEDATCGEVKEEIVNADQGKPWLYDRKVIYDGFAHTYAFVKDGKKVTLALLKPSEISKHSKREEKMFLIKKKGFSELPKEDGVYFSTLDDGICMCFGTCSFPMEVSKGHMHQACHESDSFRGGMMVSRLERE
ncbi:hypothetical protein DITRI_Ditri08aG0053700 [Diplodiscus trichospermus]